MDPAAAGGGFQRGKSLAQQASDDAREHISAAAHSHAGISGGIYVFPLPVGDTGAMPLEDHHAAQLLGGLPGRGHPILSDGKAQPDKFTLVGGENGSPRFAQTAQMLEGLECWP